MRTYIDNRELGGKNLSEGLGKVKIPLTILTYNRPEYLYKTLESFFRLNYDCIDNFIPILLNQGDSEPVKEVLKDFKEYIDIYIEKENKGCAWGYSYLMDKFLDYPYVMHLQDDWYSTEPLTHYLDQIYWVLEGNPSVGYVRLRSSQSKVYTINGVSDEKIVYRRWPKRYTFSRILVGNSHFTLNPTIVRSEVLKHILPITKERDAMEKYHELGLQAAQLKANCFNHIGVERAFTPGRGERKLWIK